MTCILNSRWYFCLGFDGILAWWLKPLAVSCKPSCHSLMFSRWLGCELLRWKRARNCPFEELAATWNFWRLLISSTDVLCSILPVFSFSNKTHHQTQAVYGLHWPMRPKKKTKWPECRVGQRLWGIWQENWQVKDLPQIFSRYIKKIFTFEVVIFWMFLFLKYLLLFFYLNFKESIAFST